MKLSIALSLLGCSFFFNEVEAARPQNPGNQGNGNGNGNQGNGNGNGNQVTDNQGNAACGNNKSYLCHHDEGTNAYKTLCISDNAINAQLRSNERNYLGQCIGDLFLERAVFMDLEPMEGVEEIDGDDGVSYQVTYNVTMLEEGIVSLGAAADLITSVTCFNDTINVEFKQIPSPDQIEFMFPDFALVVFDGNTFPDMECKLPNQDEDPDLNSSFFLIAGVEAAEDKTVTVRGLPASFHHMFDNQDLLFTPIEARRNLRNLRLAEFDISKSFDGSFQIPEGDDEKVQLSAYAKASIDASSNGLYFKTALRKQKCKRRGWLRRLRCLVDYKLEVDSSYSAAFDLTAYLKASFVAKDSLELLNGDNRFPFLSFPIYGLGFKLPRWIASVVKKIIPGIQREYYLGVKADIPAVIKYGLNVDYDVKIDAEASIATGKKEVVWALNGVVFGGLDSTFDVNELEPSKSSDIKFATDLDTDINVKVEGILSGGLEPQIVVDIIGLATGIVGLFTGFDLEGEFNTAPMEPVVSESGFPFIFNCEECHLAALKFEATAKNPFFRWKLIGKDEENKPLFGDWSLDFLIAQLCLLNAEEKTCDDSCCGNREVCILDALSNEGSCCNTEAVGAQCCRDEDCGNGATHYCDGDQQCVLRNCDAANADIECCASSDCNSGTQLCVSNICIEQGNPGFALSWCGRDDLDLHVITPAGDEIDYQNTIDQLTGGNLDKDDIPQEEGCYVENIVFPSGAPKGDYVFFVDSYTQILGADNWTVRVYLGDQEQAVQSGTEDSERFVYTLA
ncbi:unnamed protein product [Cylindrotheca closterium]|uniref:Uncharacterized protein n=1 Tax=Cylindrotheca closterium TaxID=2856 RepID=A0AAD2FM37_9STRA|nr:unnamed protein product [Cylindrotheca closterium]